MNVLPIGKTCSGNVPDMQFIVRSGMGILWREFSDQAEFLILDESCSLPATWRLSPAPWKVLGSQEFLNRLTSKTDLPTGSKVILLSNDFEVRTSLLNRTLKWKGDRIKRVLIVDDSATIRKLLRHIIEGFKDWQIVGELDSAELLAPTLKKLYPDLVTLDLNLPGMNGVEAMRRHLAPAKIPTILISSQPKEDGTLVMDALAAGALDYLQKPEAGKWNDSAEDLKAKMEAAIQSKWMKPKLSAVPSKPTQKKFLDLSSIIVIGSSTGGTQALQEIFLRLPESIPPILVTQHIPPIFSKALADRLNSLCPFEVKEAENGDEVRAGRILIAPGGFHMKLAKGGARVEIVEDEPINRFRPSVDALFQSVALHSKRPVIAAILTGMGKDGAQGILELKQSGAYTIAQNEETCVVFGMPKEAIRLGAAREIVPLDCVAEQFFMASEYFLNPKRKGAI